jgi:hypothetical protein
VGSDGEDDSLGGGGGDDSGGDGGGDMLERTERSRLIPQLFQFTPLFCCLSRLLSRQWGPRRLKECLSWCKGDG